MSASKPDYTLNDSGEFVITDYNSAKPFSSFFPGVAGANGIPMWTFYVNRGQCLCSMGIQDKEHAIMEFLPANRAYQLAATQGFRTFIKTGNDILPFYEPFQKHFRDSKVTRTQRMSIAPSKLTLEEQNESLGLTFTVEYFNIPQDDYPGLIRTLRIANTGSSSVSLQALDGLPLIIPYGVDNSSLKFTRRLVEAFVEVVNHERKAPLFRGKVEPVDRPEVVRIKQGNFYLGFDQDVRQNGLITPIVDPARIFGSQNDYSYPERFLAEPVEEILSNQVLENRFPCAMGLFETTILPGASYTYTSIIGHTASVDELNKRISQIACSEYVTRKKLEDRELIEKLTQGNFICSSEPTLDQYTRQNYLDNGLRGGFPVTLQGDSERTAFYLYSRKHGDLERDYNHFSLSPSKYSQGNGNYRDVNQNRRNDLFFNPDVREDNIEHFYNLIQLDGFNPLVIKEIYFVPKDETRLTELLSSAITIGRVDAAKQFFSKPFTPGSLTAWLEENGIKTTASFLGNLLAICNRITSTEHGEGFWTDHWTYNLDLLENYLALYPENERFLLFEKKSFSFHDNCHRIQPRADKYVLWDGKPMQLNAVVLDEEKQELIKQRSNSPNQMRTNFGHGQSYRTTLANKIISLIVIKLASLDPEGVGVEMEADKPNWYDALNGLPGLIGSSINETLEIKRNILYLQKTLHSYFDTQQQWLIYEEMGDFLLALNQILRSNLTPFQFWDRSTALKEEYRNKIRLGISGHETDISVTTVLQFLEIALVKLSQGVEKAHNREEGVLSTYFINEVIDYSLIKNVNGSTKTNPKGMPCFYAKAFKQLALPLFLEGPVHYLRTLPGIDKARELAENIRQSGLYDRSLNMYKVNATLEDQPMEIGRARVFSRGWFENESIWLHMEYKYMLELLRNRLFEEFYRDFKVVMVPFFDPATYGRSILENSSFIVSSSNPDPTLHGNGFVARLSGATAEFMNIMLLMTVGPKPFRISESGELQLGFDPALPGWLFTETERNARLFINGQWQDIILPSHSFSFMFLGEILVTFHNPKREHTFGVTAVTPVAWTISDSDDKQLSFSGKFLRGVIAEKIRNREIKRIEIELG